MLLSLALLAPLVLSPQDIPTLSVEGTRDRTGEGVAFLEVTAGGEALYVHAPLSLRLRFGVEVGFLEDNVIQLFRRDLDLPVQLQADWLAGLPGATALEVEPGGTISFALDDRIVETGPLRTVERDGKQYRVLELERWYLPVASGELHVSAGLLRFAYATEFREDFVNGRVPADRVDAYVLSQPLTLTVRELPLTGQPVEFRGAVGKFTIRAAAEPRDLVAGEHVQLELTIEAQGAGNLEHLEPPPLTHLRDFNVLGSVDELVDGARRITYDLEPRGTRAREVPAIAFVYFDPGESAYRTVTTLPLPIRVRPRVLPAARAADDSGAPDTQWTAWHTLTAGGAVAALLLAAFVFRLRRRRAPSPRLLRQRARAAADAFRRRAAQPDFDPADALVEFLAVLLACPHAAVVSPDLARDLHTVGVSREASESARALLEALLAPRYGGPELEDGPDAARTLVEELAPD